MYDLARFSLHDITDCGTALRRLSLEAHGIEEVAARIVEYLYTNLGGKLTGQKGCALVRFFKTCPYCELDEDCRRYAEHALGRVLTAPTMKCFTLIGTAGDRPEWNAKESSRQYRAIPLASAQFIRQFPMFSQLLKQFGVTFPLQPRGDSDFLIDSEATTYNVFYVPEAVGSPFVPVQQEFVIPFGIRSVLGFGGLLPSQDLFAVILFSKVHIPKETADLFRTLALSVKLALLPFDGSNVPPAHAQPTARSALGPAPPQDDMRLLRYQSQIETLEQLLKVHEQTVIADIIERQRAEEALRDSEERFRGAFDYATIGMALVATDGRFLQVNQSLCKIVGYSEEELLATTFQAITHPDDLQADLAQVHRVLMGEIQTYQMEKRYFHKHGHIVWVLLSVSLVRNPHGRPLYFVSQIQDITERKRAEEQLQSTLDRLRTLSRRLEVIREEERTRIARELHDELGVGLTCLKIDLSRLNTSMDKAMTSAARHKVDAKIRSMVEHIDMTIQSVQRIVTELRPAVLDDLGLVAAIEWQTQDFQRRTGIACACTVGQEDIRVDSERATAVFRICQEALTNVARHARASSVSVRLEERNGQIVLDVRDNGQGIPEYKLSDPQSLGLLGMRERAGLFGGQVTVSGQPGEGTTITLHLPSPRSTS